MRVEPFAIDVEEPVLYDLGARLEHTRWPSPAPGEPWAQGTDLAWLQSLVAYWEDGFDWRARERALNAYRSSSPTWTAFACTSSTSGAAGLPLILTHGWPSAFTELLALIDRLPAFDLVIPSLPGYAFSSRPPVCTTRDVASLWHKLMQGLGYERYGAGGGDWGAAVTTYMALEAPERLLGIHLSNLDNAPTPATPLSAAEQAFVAATDHWDATERGYSFEQGTKPQTLAYGLTDSPVALAAWLLEKWRSWADTGGDLARFDRDFLLELVTLYWVTNSIATANRDYFDNRAAGTALLGPGVFVTVPTAIANFHGNHVSEGVLPREWAERIYNVERFTKMRRGGHFAAAEEPALLAADIAAFFT